MQKRIVIVLTLAVLMICSTSMAFAQTSNQDSQTNTTTGTAVNMQEKVIDVPVYDSIEDANKAAAEEQGSKQVESSNAVNVRGIGATNMSYFVVRSGNTKTCQIYGKWKSSEYVNKFSFQSLVVYNIKSNAKYLTVKPAAGHKYRWYTFTSSKMGTYKIPRNYNVPLSVKTVRIKVVDQMVSLSSYGWLSLGNFSVDKTFN